MVNQHHQHNNNNFGNISQNTAHQTANGMIDTDVMLVQPQNAGVDSQRKSIRNIKNTVAGNNNNTIEHQHLQLTEITPDISQIQQQHQQIPLGAANSSYKNKWIDFKKFNQHYPSKELDRRQGAGGFGNNNNNNNNNIAAALGINNVSASVEDVMQISGANNLRNTHNSMSPNNNNHAQQRLNGSKKTTPMMVNNVMMINSTTGMNTNG